MIIIPYNMYTGPDLMKFGPCALTYLMLIQNFPERNLKGIKEKILVIKKYTEI